MKLAIKILTHQIEYLQNLIETGNFFTVGEILDIKEYENKCRKDIKELRKAIKVLKGVKG